MTEKKSIYQNSAVNISKLNNETQEKFFGFCFCKVPGSFRQWDKSRSDSKFSKYKNAAYITGQLLFYCRDTMEKELNWPYGFRGLDSMMTEQSHGGRTAESLCLNPQVENRDTKNGIEV